MLYRNPDSPRRSPFLHRIGHALEAFRAARRRRIAHLDLMSLSPHLKQDLGLRDANLRQFPGF
jgi:uncharacterized protein YjiS (DUF1127 family)